MANTFQFKVCTPNGEVLNQFTNELILETYKGQVTLLPAHTNYTTILGSGILQFKNENDAVEKIVVTGGFINFTNEIKSEIYHTYKLNIELEPNIVY